MNGELTLGILSKEVHKGDEVDRIKAGPSFAMSSGRLFLDGVLASIAHLRFAD
jgi:hypothetical protein